MSTFAQTINPTPYAVFDSDTQFQSDADKTVVFVKRMLGDDVLSVELTKKMIWACFELASLEYGKIINDYALKSQLANLLGQPTSSNVTNTFPRQTLEFLFRQAEPYSMEAGVGGSYESTLGYIDLQSGRQDYNIYTELRDSSGSLLFPNLSASLQTKLRLVEVYHFSPVAAQSFLLNASNITNFLATEMRYESYVNSTVFYVLPIFEDVLRRSMLEAAYRVRRSNYSYSQYGPIIRIYPVPAEGNQPTFVSRLWVRVRTKPDPLKPDYGSVSGSNTADSTISGSISNPSNVPFVDIQYHLINSPGKQWIRDFTLALATIVLGRVRSKLKTLPIPGADLQLDGEELVSQGREDKEKLLDDLRTMMDDLTYDKLLERESQKAEFLNTQLKFLPMPLGKSIFIG
jgi:hypothetical protein